MKGVGSVGTTEYLYESGSEEHKTKHTDTEIGEAHGRRSPVPLLRFLTSGRFKVNLSSTCAHF